MRIPFITTCGLDSFGVNVEDHGLIYGSPPTEQVYFCELTDDVRIVELGSKTFLKEMRNYERVLLYIHGFNTKPSDTFETTMNLQELMGKVGCKNTLVVPVIWPATRNGLTTTKYFSDKDIAEMSALALSRALAIVYNGADPNKPCTTKVSILAHSMGNRVLKETIHRYRSEWNWSALPQMFEYVFMKAADTTSSIFDRYGKGVGLPEIARNVIIYYAKDDLALNASKVINGVTDSQPGPLSQRLGRVGLSKASLASLPENVFQFDCGMFNNIYDPPLGHTYFFHKGLPSPCLTHMIGLLGSDKTPPTRHSTLKEPLLITIGRLLF